MSARDAIQLSFGMLLFWGFISILILVMFVLCYIFESLALYKIMKRRKMENDFLAWIPVARYYAIGKIYDDINLKQDIKTDFAIISLVLGITVPPAFLVLKLISFNLIFKTYAPNKSNYFVMSVIFTIFPILPFLPGVFLLKASKNQPIS